MSKNAHRRSDPAGPSDGALFDRYVDSILDGEVESPEAFLARHPDAGDELRDRIRTLYREAQRDPPGAPVDLPFDRLDDFRLLRRLGEGGMGKVYEARQESLDRIVALKIVHPHIRSSPAAQARFEREAAVAARLSHPSVVTVHAFGEDRGVGYLAMEFVPGHGLDDLLRRAHDRGEEVLAADVLRWGAEIARALECVHEAGVVHRDVKPSNIRITPEGRAVLLDFGVARDDDLDRLTATGPLVGSPLYASPEQLSGGRDVDRRSDVYGLGATLYECLAGRPVVERGTVEQVIHRKLHSDPIPLRRLRERIARDLHVVVMKALEREPARRYATAGALGDDLDAVLAFEPIRARPPSLIRRATSWARSHRAKAAAAASLVVCAIVAIAVFVIAEGRRAAGIRKDARELIASAAERVRTLGDARVRSRGIENEVREYLGELEAKHLPLEHIERLDALQVEALRLRRERQESVHTVLEMLRRAEQQFPGVEGADRVRASLYLERYFAAQTWENYDDAAFFRQRVMELDSDGDVAQQIAAAGTVSFTTRPPGAAIHAFRYLALRDLPGRESPRQVPVPVHDVKSRDAGRWGLRVIDGAGVLPREALIVAVAGDPVTRDNHRRLRRRVEEGAVAVSVIGPVGDRMIDLPSGLLVRATAAPLLVGEASRLATSPLNSRDLAPGAYVFLLRLSGHEDVRVFVPMSTSTHRFLELSLLPVGTTPEGWVRIVRRGFAATEVEGWMMEREVTAAEYLVFLNDPETLATLDPDGPVRLVPRGPEFEKGFWSRGEDGTFELPADWKAAWPVVGVSFEDTHEYVRWLTKHHPPVEGSEYALPNHEEWLTAGGGATSRTYVFGDAFRPQWCSSCFSRPTANVERVMEYPIDESPCGAFDMSGSAMEWCADWWDESRNQRRLLGGSWAQGKPDTFRLHGGNGRSPHNANGESGFRLVMRRTDGFR